MAVPSDGSYNTPKDIVYSFPGTFIIQIQKASGSRA